MALSYVLDAIDDMKLTRLVVAGAPAADLYLPGDLFTKKNLVSFCKCKSKHMVDTLNPQPALTSPLDQQILRRQVFAPSSKADYCRLTIPTATSFFRLEASRSRGHDPCSSRACGARGYMPVLALAKKFLHHREQSLTAVALVWSLQPVGPRDIELAHLVLQGSALQTKAFCRAARAGNPA